MKYLTTRFIKNDGGSRSDIPKELVIDIVNQMEVLMK